MDLDSGDGSIKITIEGDAKDLEQSMQQVASSLKGAEAAVKSNSEALKEHAGVMDQAKSSALDLYAKVGLLKDAYSGAQAAIRFFSDGLRSLSSLKEVSDVTGASVEMLSKYKVAMETAGIGTQQFGQAIKGMSRFITEAGEASSRQAKLLDALGISLAALRKQDPTQQMATLGSAIGAINDPALKSTLAIQVFQRGYQGMMRMFADGPAAFQKFGSAAEELGIVFSKDIAAKANEAVGNLILLKNALVEAPKTNFFAGLAPGLAQFTDTLDKELIGAFGRINLMIRDLGKIAGEFLNEAVLPAIEKFAERASDPNVGFGGAVIEAFESARPELIREAEMIGKLIGEGIAAAARDAASAGMKGLTTGEKISTGVGAAVGLAGGAYIGAPSTGLGLGAVLGSEVPTWFGQIKDWATGAIASFNTLQEITRNWGAEVDGVNRALEEKNLVLLDQMAPVLREALAEAEKMPVQFAAQIIGLTDLIEKYDALVVAIRGANQAAVEGSYVATTGSTVLERQTQGTYTSAWGVPTPVVMSLSQGWKQAAADQKTYTQGLGLVQTEAKKTTGSLEELLRSLLANHNAMSQGASPGEQFQQAQQILNLVDQVKQGTLAINDFETAAKAIQQEHVKGMTDEMAKTIDLSKAEMTFITGTIAQTVAKTASLEAYNATFAATFALTGSVAEATRDAAQAEKEAQIIQEAKNKGLEKLIPLYRQVNAELQKQQDIQAADKSLDKWTTDIKGIQNEIALYQLMLQGRLTQKEVEHEIAVEQAAQQLSIGRTAEEARSMAEQLIAYRDELEHLKSAGVDIGASLVNGVEQSLDAVISGTRKLSDVWSGIGTSIGKEFVTNFLKEKLGLDLSFKTNILGLASWAADALGGVFNAAGATGAGGWLQNIAGMLLGAGGGGGGGSGIASTLLKSGVNYAATGGQSTGNPLIDMVLGKGASSPIQFFYPSAGAGGVGAGGTSFGFPFSGSVPYASAGGPANFADLYYPGTGDYVTGAAVGPDYGGELAGAGGGNITSWATGLIGSALGTWLGSLLGGKVGSSAIGGFQNIAEQASSNFAGAISGTIGGAIAGAIVGSIVPGIGTLIGGLLGGALGGFGGSAMGAITGAQWLRSGAIRNPGGLGTTSQYALGLHSSAMMIPSIISGNALSDMLGIKPMFSAGGVNMSPLNLLDPTLMGPIQMLLGLIGQMIWQGPTAGSLRRRSGESALDSMETFKTLQEQLGDITRSKPRLLRNPDLLEQRVDVGDKGLLDISGFAALFAQKVFGDQVDSKGHPKGENVASSVVEWTNILTDFFSRMHDAEQQAGADSKEVGLAIKQNLASAFKDMGVDATSAMALMNKLAASLAMPTAGPTTEWFGETIDQAQSLGKAMLGTADIMESEMPAGVHLAALALESMSKDGVKFFGNLDQKGHDTLVNLSKDTENFSKVLAHLYAEGYTIDVEDFKKRLADIEASAKEVGASLGGLFDATSFESGVQGMLQHLGSTIKQTVTDAFTSDLFKNTNFATIFEPVTHVLNNMDQYDLSKPEGIDQFKADIVPAIAEGKKNLEAYLPILRTMYDQWKEINDTIDKALEPTQAEKMATVLADAFNGIGDIFSGAIQAGLDVLSSGGTMTEATAAFNENFSKTFTTTIRQAIFNGILQTVIIAPLIAQWLPAFQYVIAVGLIKGFTDPGVVAAFATLMAGITTQVEGLAPLIMGSAEDAYGLTGTAAEKFFAKMKADVESLNSSLASGLGSLIKDSIDIAYKDGIDAGKKHFDEGLGQVIYDVVYNALITAFVNALMAQSTLGPMIEQGAALLYAAKSPTSPGGTAITPGEQSEIDAWKVGFKEAVTLFKSTVQDFANWMFGPDGPMAGSNAIPGPEGTGAEGPHAGMHLETRNGDLVWVSDYTRQFPSGPGTGPVISGGGNDQNRAPRPTGPGPTGPVTGGGGGNDQNAAPRPDATDVPDATKTYVDSTSKTAAAVTTLGGVVELAGIGLANHFVDMMTGIGDAATALGGLAALINSLKGPTAGPESTGGDTGGDTTTTGGGRRTIGPAVNPHAGQHLETHGGDIVWVDNQRSATSSTAHTQSTAEPPGGSIGSGREGPHSGGGGGGRTTIPQPYRGDRPPTPTPKHMPGYGFGGNNPLIGPDDDRNPANQKQNPLVFTVSLDMSSAVEEYLRGGSKAAFEKALKEQTAEAVIKGLIEGMLATGPIKQAIDNYNKQMQAATQRAMKDGVIDAGEQADLNALSKKLQKGITDAVEKEKPIIEAVGKALGKGVKESVQDSVADIGGSISQAIGDFLAGGSLTDLQNSVNKAIYDAMTSAIITSILDTGPVADEIERFGKRFGKAYAHAIKDGNISPAEEARLVGIATRFGGKITGSLKDMKRILGPLFDDWAEKLGITLPGSVADVFGNAIQDAVNKHISVDELGQNLKNTLYAYVVQGLTSAFIQSAVVGGVLAPFLETISSIFDKIINKEISIAEGVGLIIQGLAGIGDMLNSPEWKAAWAAFLAGLEEIRGSIGAMPDAVRDTSSAVDDANQTVKDSCDGECTLQYRAKELELANTILNQAGRAGQAKILYGEPVNPATGPGSDAWSDIPNTRKNTPGSTGDDDWRAWQDPATRKAWRKEHPNWLGPHVRAPWKIPAMQEGGILMAPQLVVAGHGGGEAVIPLDQLHAQNKALQAAVEKLTQTVEQLGKKIESMEFTGTVDNRELFRAVSKGSRRANKRRRRGIHQGSVG